MRKIALVLVMAFLAVGAVPAWALQDSWNMVASMGEVPESGGSNRDITLNVSGSGDYDALTNSVEWIAAPAWGVVENSAAKNPGTDLVALGARVTVTSVGGTGYSGNVIQKGEFSDPGQIKLSIVPTLGGAFTCRFKGTTDSQSVLNNKVTNVDDGEQYVVYCVRNGDTLKTVVNGEEEERTLDVGSISNDKNLTLGNKGATADASDQHFGKNTCSAYAYGAGAIAYVEGELDDNC